MAEDKNKLKEEQLQEEQLDEANGGGTSTPPKDVPHLY